MIEYSFAAACAAMFLVNVLRWQKLYKHNYIIYNGDAFEDRTSLPMDRRPFNCTVCMSGWLGLIIGLIAGHRWESLLMLGIAAVFGLVIDNAARRYL